MCISNNKQTFRNRICVNQPKLNREHFGFLITEACHLGMWNVNMHQISNGTLQMYSGCMSEKFILWGAVAAHGN